MMRNVAATVLVLFTTQCAVARADHQVETKTIKSFDGTPLVCEVSGHGNTAIIFIHGWCGDRGYWKHQVDEFAPKFKIVAYDQAGHGESGKTRKNWTVDSLAQDVESIVKDLGLKRVVVVGHSMGGPVGLASAKRMAGTVIAVVGVDTLQNAEMVMAPEMLKQFLEGLEKDFPKSVAGMVPSMISEKTDPKVGAAILSRAEKQDKTMAIALMKDMWTLDNKAIMKDAKVPIRCINSSGGFKFFRPTQPAVNKKYADYEVLYIDDVGHYPMLEKPKEFNQKLAEVLKEVDSKK